MGSYKIQPRPLPLELDDFAVDLDGALFQSISNILGPNRKPEAHPQRQAVNIGPLSKYLKRLSVVMLRTYAATRLVSCRFVLVNNHLGDVSGD